MHTKTLNMQLQFCNFPINQKACEASPSTNSPTQKSKIVKIKHELVEGGQRQHLCVLCVGHPCLPGFLADVRRAHVLLDTRGRPVGNLKDKAGGCVLSQNRADTCQPT